MPKGGIYSKADRAYSKYEHALKKKDNVSKAREEAMEAADAKVFEVGRLRRKKDGSYEKVRTADTSPYMTKSLSTQVTPGDWKTKGK